jgi:predicted oxidoreductase
MKHYTLPQTDLSVSRLAYGCMQIGKAWDYQPLSDEVAQHGFRIIELALEHGINFFDHADIYCMGKSEEIFGRYLKAHPAIRSQIVLQSKCGIHFGGHPHPSDPARFDFSKEHILESVDGILKRLNTDYLDILLLHRPDPLVEPEEVASAFDNLHASGKVRYFGVSNQNAMQMELLRRYVRQPIVVNQLEFNIVHNHLVNDGIQMNIDSTYTAGGALEYCRLHEITVQAWSPVAGGKLFNPSPDLPKAYHDTASIIQRLANVHNTSPEAIALAWILRHPAHIQPVLGTTNLDRLKASFLADDVIMNRKEWYELFTAGRGRKLP